MYAANMATFAQGISVLQEKHNWFPLCPSLDRSLFQDSGTHEDWGKSSGEQRSTSEEINARPFSPQIQFFFNLIQLSNFPFSVP